MQFKINAKRLTEALSIAVKAIGKSLEPIFDCVLMEFDAEDGNLKLTCGCSDLFIEVKIEVNEVIVSGKTAVIAKDLLQLVKNFGYEEIELKLKKTLEITADKSKYTLKVQDPEMFPVVPAAIGGKEFFIPLISNFNAGIDKVSFCVAPPDETRRVLKGVLFEIWGDNNIGSNLNLVAADGRRCAKTIIDIEGDKDINIREVIGQKCINIISSIPAEQINVIFTANNVKFIFNNITVTSSLLEGKFPDYKQIIPARTEKSLIVKKQALIDALSRIISFSSDKGVKVRAEENKILLYSYSISEAEPKGEGIEELEATMQETGDCFCVNGQYLLDTVKRIEEEEVTINYSDKINPLLIKDSKSLHVIMPVRINKE